jgi:hypothetical protein
MSDYMVKPLNPDTWDAFARLVERHNGVWSGCWCTWFHPSCAEKGQAAEGNRALKERLVNEGWAHAALVLTVMWRWPGASTESRRNCRTSTTERSTRQVSTDCLTTDSPASSWIGGTGAREWQASRFVVLYT